MLGLDNHSDTTRVEFLFKRISYLHRHLLLYLQAASETIDQPGQLAKADHAPALSRQVGYVGEAKERQQVVLAGGVKFNPRASNYLVVTVG
jgi:hypothetical protein